MRPRAAEGVPVLDVKTPDCSWIVGEETVVDDLECFNIESWIRKPECLCSRSQLLSPAQPRRPCPHLPRIGTKNKSSMSEGMKRVCESFDR